MSICSSWVRYCENESVWVGAEHVFDTKITFIRCCQIWKKLQFFLKVQGNLLMIFLVFGKILNIFSKYFVIFKFSLLYYLEWSNIEKIF